MDTGEHPEATGSVDDGLHVGCLASDGYEMNVLVLELGKGFDDEGQVLSLLDTTDEEDVALG